MAQTNLDLNASSLFANLITFQWGASSVARYIRDFKNFTDDLAQVYTALPLLQIDMKKQGGGADDEGIVLTMPSVRPIDSMLLQFPYNPVDVIVEELDTTDLTTRRVTFKGRISRIIGNKNGRSGVNEVTVGGIKTRFSAPLGIPCLNTCAWNFGDKSCKIDLATLQLSTTCVSVAKNIITMASSAHAAGYWSRGFVTVDGLNLMIREHSDVSELRMIDNVPLTWAGLTLNLIPGCDKTKATCSTKFSNIANFGGFGIAIPKYHPVYETQ